MFSTYPEKKICTSFSQGGHPGEPDHPLFFVRFFFFEKTPKGGMASPGNSIISVSGSLCNGIAKRGLDKYVELQYSNSARSKTPIVVKAPH